MRVVFKKFLSLALVFSMLTAIFSVSAFAAQSSKIWQYVGGAGISAGEAEYIGLVFDRSGVPYAAYTDQSDGRQTVVKKYDKGTQTWQPVGNAVSGGSSKSVSLAFNSSGEPYVAYQESSSQGITVKKYNAQAQAWQTVGLENLSGGTAYSVSLAISRDDVPYVAFMDGSNILRATVMKYTASGSTGWEPVGTAGFTQNGVDYLSLVFDNSNIPNLAFMDNSVYGKATVMKYTGVTAENATGWETVGTAGFSENSANYEKLAFDNSGTPYVAYRSGSEQKATVMKYTGGGSTGWEPVGSQYFSNGAAAFVSLVIDSGGTPYVAYKSTTDFVNNITEAAVMKYTGGSGTGWESVGSGDISDGNARHTSLALNSDGTLWLAYEDEANANKLSVKKYDYVKYTVDYGAGNHGTLSGSLNETVNSGGSPQNIPTVSPESGYIFTGWSSDGITVLTSGQLAQQEITGNVIYTAQYRQIAEGDQFTENGIRYEITNISSGEVKVISNPSSYSGKVTIPDSVAYGSADYDVTSIGDHAFAGCTGLMNVTVAKSVRSIEAYAFSGCTGLTDITFSGGAPQTVGENVFAGGHSPVQGHIPNKTALEYRSVFSAYYPAQIVFDDGSEASGIISSFESLPSSVEKQSVAYGTEYGSLNLPKTLKAVVDSISNATVKVFEWVSSVTYNPDKAGSYKFTPVLDSGFQLKDSGVKLPEITVTVKEKAKENSSSDKTKKQSAPAPKTETRVDPSGNTAVVTTAADGVSVIGDSAEITATVLTVTSDTTGAGTVLDAGKAAQVKIKLPEDALLQQLNAQRNVDLTLAVPQNVAQAADRNMDVSIKAAADLFAAAKTNRRDLTVRVMNADTRQLSYSWTFKGSDLAASSVPVADVNLSLNVRSTDEVSLTRGLPKESRGLVLTFSHSGLLPSAASVTFSAKDKGFRPGQKLYFYFYNPDTGSVEKQDKEYTVDADGNVTVQISHCSQYLLTPQKIRSITVDTRSYTMTPGMSYETGLRLTGTEGAKVKAYSSAKDVAKVVVLKNGNVRATGLKEGMTYVMIDVYDSRNKFLTHASVRLSIKNGVKPGGSSARQVGIF
ncbi:leucine-rich repeat protein [Caproiciproducens sp.]|uniref:leucine-rich repeat protein n=1 Tax=Caproiciproducens sp. TaxID=1954376 RepID=UPI00289F2605|nr:leucine-rich repeat protein [Caproiciproducens sp.]